MVNKNGPSELALAIAILMLGMVIFLFAAGLCHLVAGSEPRLDAYQAAYAESQHASKPLLLHYGATWCEPCKEVERVYGPSLRTRGVYLHLDIDRDRELIYHHGLPLPQSVPQLYYWSRDARGGWSAPQIYVGLPGISIFVLGR
jgi:thiol-disulfide isomerase/thioredoxin